MKKLLKVNATNIILWALFSLGISLFIVIVPIAFTVSDNFSDTLKYSIPIAITFSITFWATIFYNLMQDLKIRNAIIKKFSLKENDFTEVLVFDSLLFPFESSILIDAIQFMSDGENEILKFINIEKDTLALPYDNMTPACYTLIKTFKEFGGKFYLSLDNNHNIFLSLKDKENELLSTTKLISERNFEGVLNGFTSIDDED